MTISTSSRPKVDRRAWERPWSARRAILEAEGFAPFQIAAAERIASLPVKTLTLRQLFRGTVPFCLVTIGVLQIAQSILRHGLLVPLAIQEWNYHRVDPGGQRKRALALLNWQWDIPVVHIPWSQRKAWLRGQPLKAE